MSSKLVREPIEIWIGRGSSSGSGKTGASSGSVVPKLSSQLPNDRVEREESIGEDIEALEELSLNLGAGIGAGAGAGFDGAVMTKTSSGTRKVLGTCGTGGTTSSRFIREVVELLGAAADDDLARSEPRVERVSRGCFAVGARGVLGIEAYASMVREGPEEKRSKALRLKDSSLGATASVAVERAASLAVLLLPSKFKEGRDLPRESRCKKLFFSFLSLRP